MSLTLRSTDRRNGMALAVTLHLAVMALLLQTWTHFPPAPRDTASTIEIFVPIAAEAEDPEVAPRELDQSESSDSQEPRSNALATDRLPPPPSSLPPPPVMETPLARIDVSTNSGPASGMTDGATAIGPGSASGDGSGSGARKAAGESAADSRPGAGPVWIRKPTEDQFLDALSFEAKHDRQDGFAILSCLVTPRGTVRDCRVLEETNSPRPAFGGSYAFGRAALRLSRYFVVAPPVRNNQPRYDIRVSIPVNWNFQ